MHRAIEFHQKSLLKSYLDLKADLKKKQKMLLQKIFLNWLIREFLEKHGKCEKTQRYQTCND